MLRATESMVGRRKIGSKDTDMPYIERRALRTVIQVKHEQSMMREPGSDESLLYLPTRSGKHELRSRDLRWKRRYEASQGQAADEIAMA